jgi:hypothetical protein
MVEMLPEPAKYYLDQPFDSELVDYLSDMVRERQSSRGW